VAPSVVILPNNGNVIMTAEQTLGLTRRRVYVVPTQSPCKRSDCTQQLAYERRSSGAVNAEEMGGGCCRHSSPGK
jgi:dihydroxyacetone kinase-like predicted kinase